MPCKTLSASRTPMARLFMLKSFLIKERSYIITTDNDEDIKLLREFAKNILECNVTIIEDIYELWRLEEQKSGISVVPVNLWYT